MIYLDNARIMQPVKHVRDFVRKNSANLFAPTDAYYFAGIKSAALLEQARIMTANHFGVSPSTIRFTSGLTEANNIICRFALDENIKTIITSRFEHPSILDTLKQISNNTSKPLIYVPLNQDSSIDLKELRKILRQNPWAFVSLSHVNRLTGRLLPVNRITTLCHKYSSVFHCDMSLSAAYLDLDLSHIPIDFVSFSSEKCGGIRGAGVVYMRRPASLKPIFYGDKKEYGLRPGNENIIAIYSLALALQTLKQKQKVNYHRLLTLKKLLFKQLKRKNIKYTSISEPLEHFLPNIVNLNFDVHDFQKFLYLLDLNNVAVMPMNKGILPYNSIIVSTSFDTPQSHILKFTNILSNIL